MDVFFLHHFSISNKKRLYFVLALLISYVILLISFSSTSTQAISSTLKKRDDGQKSYCKNIYQIKYDGSQSVCKNMNYPHEEQILYTNGHNPIIFIIKIIFNHIINISNYTIDTPTSMLFPFIITFMFLYLIFRHLKIEGWFAIPIAVGITCLSPQIDRLLDHYGLAYFFVILGIIYALLKFHERQNYIYSYLIALYILFIETTHPYHFIATLPLVIAYLVVMMLLHLKNRKQLITPVLHFIIQICIPYALTELWEQCSYHITNRTAAPWGIFDYYSVWGDIYSVDKIFTSIFLTSGASWEGMAFISHFTVFFYFSLFSVPLLLITAKCNKLNASEHEIVAHANKITKTDLYGMYQVNPSYLAERITQNLIKIKSKYHLTSNNNNAFIRKTFDTVTASRTYKRGAYGFTVNTYKTVLKTEVTSGDSAQFTLSFWSNRSKLDYPQATTFLINKSLNNAPALEGYLGLHRNKILFDDDWFLTKYPISIAIDSDKKI